MADVHAEVRHLLLTGQRPRFQDGPRVPAWRPTVDELWADAPFHVKEARRAAPVFGRLAAAGCQFPQAEPMEPAIRASFSIVGTVKGGTSALHHFLSQHPSICAAIQKETHFFCRDIFFEHDAPQYEWYSLSFSVRFSGEQAVGEATPDYMYYPQIPLRLAKYNPQLKLIFLLRNPVTRAYSDYCMRVARSIERRSFSSIIDEEAELLSSGEDIFPRENEVPPRYLGAGLYMRFIRRYLELFPRDQMLFVRSEDLRDSHYRTLADVHEFLGVDSQFMPQPQSVLRGSGPPIQRADKHRLLDFYDEEIKELERFTGWDLQPWRS